MSSRWPLFPRVANVKRIQMNSRLNTFSTSWQSLLLWACCVGLACRQLSTIVSCRVGWPDAQNAMQMNSRQIDRAVLFTSTHTHTHSANVARLAIGIQVDCDKNDTTNNPNTAKGDSLFFSFSIGDGRRISFFSFLSFLFSFFVPVLFVLSSGVPVLYSTG